MSDEQERELDRQIGCVANRLRALAGQRMKGSLTVHFDGAGFLGKNFTENFVSSRDSYSPERMGRELSEDEFGAVVSRLKQ
jgi:hypothetical protein